MRHAIFSYATPNLGDDVQALAAAVHLPSVDAYVDRDRLDEVRLDQPHRLVMNSWFAVRRHRAVPAPCLEPIYYGQCVGRPEILNEAWLAEWRRHQPIGCRDTRSVGLLRARGIDAHFTGCLTTFMGRMFHPPERREGVVLVDVPDPMLACIPDRLRDRARVVTNETVKRGDSPKARFAKAARVLDIIRQAEMVVTRRLHTALPCVGFGTPVTVYLRSSEGNRGRFSGADRFLPIIFHDGTSPIAGQPTWIEPVAPRVTDEMERRYRALRDRLGTPERKWDSVARFVETLPETAREPAPGLWERVKAWV